MRIVIDTSVLVSGLIRPQGAPGDVLRSLRDGKFAALYSNETIMEIVDVLGRNKFRQKYHIEPDDISALINLIRLRGEAIVPEVTIIDCRGPKGNKFLVLPLTGGADYLVSGDSDLLSMNPYQSIPILNPAEFLAVI